MDNVISVRLSEEQMAVLEKLCEATGWTYSQVIRRLLENASVRPATIQTDLGPKGNALAGSVGNLARI